MENLWVPNNVNKQELKAQRVVQEYDERLELARHELTGDWVVCLKMEGGSLYPVIGLGRDLPDPYDLKIRIRKADLRREGSRMLDEINKNNERIRQEYARKAEEGAGKMAEALEWGFRKKGVGNSPVYIPRDI